MKKLIFISAIAFIYSVIGIAQTEENTLKKDIKSKDKEKSEIKKEIRKDRQALRKLEGKEVAYKSKQQFTTDFGSNVTDVNWTRTLHFDEVNFTRDGKKWTAYYDFNSNLVGTTTTKSFSELPANAQKTILEKYKQHANYVIFYDDNEANETDMLLWGIQFDGEDIYFLEAQKDNKKIMLKITQTGDVSYFSTLP